jgi:hypothetical protein
MPKNLDASFLQYGVRKDDMALLEILARERGLDFGWTLGLLKSVHAEKIKNDDLDDKALEKIIEQSLQRLPSDNELLFYSDDGGDNGNSGKKVGVKKR